MFEKLSNFGYFASSGLKDSAKPYIYLLLLHSNNINLLASHNKSRKMYVTGSIIKNLKTSVVTLLYLKLPPVIKRLLGNPACENLRTCEAK